MNTFTYPAVPRKKEANKKDVIPAGMAAANASIEYRPKKIRSVNSMTVVAPMLNTRGRLILKISLYLPNFKKNILFTINFTLHYGVDKPSNMPVNIQYFAILILAGIENSFPKHFNKSMNSLNYVTEQYKSRN